MIKIDKKVPLPDPEIGRGKKKMYPFKEMEIGDSFAIPFVDTEDARRKQSNVMSASRVYRLAGKRFTTHINRETKELRVWRVD